MKIENQFNKQREQLDETLLLLEAEKVRVGLNSDVAKKIQEQIDKIKELRGELDKSEKDQKDRTSGSGNSIEAYMKRLEDQLKDTDGMIVSLAQSIESELGSAMSNAITGVIDGTKTAEEAFTEMFANIGKAFIDMATEMIARALILQALGIFTGGNNVQAPSRFAEGGYVTGPTNALVGEGGSDEYVVPSSKMDGAMQRWNQGMRGDAVVSGAEPTGGAGGISGADSPTNIVVEGGVLNFNDSQYIRQDQIPSIVKQASSAGEARALRKLQMSPSARKRIGI